MSFEDSEQDLQRLINEFDGDLFQVTNYISDKARKLSTQVNDSISTSESITWAITDKPPNDIGIRIKQHMNVYTNRTAYLENLLENIMEEDIEVAVRQSFDTSIKVGSLTFYYGKIYDIRKKVRVRILTRMCWFNKDINPNLLSL